MATIYEVAAHAEVSPATVSRVINGTAVRPELQERVQQAIKVLNYRPSRRARALRTKQSEMIALVIPDIINPFFTALARGAEHVMREAGYSLVLCNTDDIPEYERSYVEIIQGEHMPGAIVAPIPGAGSFMPLLAEGRPLVSVDRLLDSDTTDAVVADNYAGATAATEWLFAQGRERVACITGPASLVTAQERAEGWRDVAAREGALREDYLIWSDFRTEGAESALKQLMSMPEPPDAIMAANNMTAIGALAGLRAMGLTPNDVPIAACESLPFIDFPVAGVHTVPLPARAIGEEAARLLLARIDGDTSPPQTIVLDSQGERVPPASHPVLTD